MRGDRRKHRRNRSPHRRSRRGSEIYPGARAEPRMPPQVYKAISDAIQACQLNGQDPAQAAKAASDQIDSFLSGYKGAPIL